MLVVALLALVAAGCQGNRAAAPTVAPTAATAPPAGKVVFNGTYSQNIQPIFDQNCVSCHGASRAENGLRLDSYDGVMKGTQHGTVVTPGNPNTSALVSVIKGAADPSIQMPHGMQPLPSQDVQNIILWIQAGAPRS
jgi:mono/diheme cytochrome c family protein